MASGRLSFSIALNMVTAQFKQGAEQVKNALRNIQYQVLGMASALGAGAFGLSELVSRFVDVARETNRARMALRNISGDAAMFGKNMNYLTNLAQQYGQDLNTLTTNFARFSAASNAAGVSLADQEKIYSSITKSITAFGLGGEEANLTFMALGQMMSKGKISSEELRRQMGERIPIAMQAMANAAGVTIQQLDKMLKNGEIYSKDVLPRFAEELDKLTGSINVDNIETSVNRLKNAFIKLTDDLKIGEYYKKIVDGATKMLSTIQSMFTTFVGIIVGGGIGKIFNAFVTLKNSVLADNAKILANKLKAEEQAVIATANRVAAEKKFNEMSVLYSKAADEEKIKYYAQYKAAESNMDKMRLRETAAIKAKEVAVNANAALTTQTVWGAAWTKVGLAIKGAATAAWGLAKAFAPMAILMAIGAIVGKLIEARNVAKETAKIFDNYKDGFKNSGSTEEIVKLNQLKKLSDEFKGNKDDINVAQQELLRMLGLQKGDEDKINGKLRTRISLLEAAARVDFAVTEKLNAEKRKKEIYRQYGGFDSFMDASSKVKQRDNTLSTSPALGAQVGLWVEKTVGKLGIGKTGRNEELRRANDELNQLGEVIWQADKDIQTYGLDAIRANSINLSGGNTDTPTDDKNKKKDKEKKHENYISDYDKEVKEYSKKLHELKNLKDRQIITEYEYEKRLKDLNASTLEAVGGMDNLGFGGQNLIEYLKGNLPKKEGLTAEKARDTTFDYKKTELEKLQEQYDIVNDYLEKLKKIAPEALDEINRKEKELLSLSEALKVAELKEDIENLNKDIFSESIDGITGFANSIDSIANSWERVANADMSGWERMIATINALGDSVKGLTGAWETYKAIKELIDTKEKASAALSLINSGKVIAASGSEATADLVAGTAKTFKANAGIPVVGAAIAIAGVAGILAMLASLPKFEKGGIIGGSSYGGDKILGRFNSGERVLTRPDQAYLTKVLKGGTTGGGNVEFKIKGKELVGILQQENTRARR